MKLNAYSIFDSAAGAYARPFFVQSDAQAVRSFKDVVADAEHPIGAHPEDYYLVRIGVFDDNSGKFQPEDVETLMTGPEAVAAMRNVERPKLEALQESIKVGGTA